MQPISEWFKRTFSDPQIVLLIVLLALALLAITLFANMLAPAIAAVVVAFVLDGPTNRLRNLGLANWLAVTIAFLAFLALMAIAFFTILPPLIGQLTQFIELLPNMAGRLRNAAMALPENYPGLVSVEQINDMINGISEQFIGVGRDILQYSVSGLTSVVVLVVYMILVPVMVFFFLKDRDAILSWLAGFLPQHRPLADQVWGEVVERTGDYARGKVYEIIIVGLAAWITYTLLGLRFTTLLAVLTGLSVIIPYIGAAVITLPVAFVAFFQWGLETQFLIAVGAYLVLQALDGNLLAPLLFSEVVKLHPNAIILAILIFGGIWGLWGVFFAIPLATLAHAVIKAWPKGEAARLGQETAEDGGPAR